MSSKFFERHPEWVKPKLIGPHHLASEVWVANTFRTLSTWLFGLVRNVILLGGLEYFAEKSHSTALWIAFYFGALMLVSYVYSYVQEIYLCPFEQWLSSRFGLFLDGVLNAIIGAAVSIGGSFAAFTVARRSLRYRRIDLFESDSRTLTVLGFLVAVGSDSPLTTCRQEGRQGACSLLPFRLRRISA